jgi:hypothetical protein
LTDTLASILAFLGTCHQTLRPVTENNHTGFIFIAFDHALDFHRRRTFGFHLLELFAARWKQGDDDEKNSKHLFLNGSG